MENSERRLSKRVPAKFQVNYVHDGDYIISYSKDISIDGMFLFTKCPAKLGETTDLTFAVGNMKDVEIKAEVVWVNNGLSDKDSGMALKFIDPSMELQDLILRTINRVAVLAAS